MRLLVLFLVCSIGLTYAADSYAQKALISIDVRNQRVEDVLKEIEAQSDFDFFFNNKHVDLNRRVSISADKSNIFSVLKEVFAGTNVIYSVLDKKIILSVKAQLPQQDKKVIVSGTVLDVQGDPIIGASVSEKDVLENGTITDMNGFFKLSVSSSKARLQISYLGYQTQIARVSVGKQIAIVLEEDTKTLDEVVVIGYGAQKKVNLTGSVAYIKLDDQMNSRPIASVSAVLNGLSAGVGVTQSSGQPGTGATIRIRGTGTLNNSNPLVLVDGVEWDMDAVNPNDIESISILKDASSTAIYGSQGANGVILITTKKGSGKPRFNYNGYVSVQKAINKLKLVSDYADYMDLVNETATNIGNVPIYSQPNIDLWRAAKQDPMGLNDYGVPNYIAYPNTEWFDVLFDTGLSQSHHISMAGSSDKMNYSLALGFLDNPGIMNHWGINSGQKKVTIQSRVEGKVGNWLTVGANVYGNKENVGVAGVAGAFQYLTMSVPGIYPGEPGKYGIPASAEESTTANNVLTYLDRRGKDERFNATLSGYFIADVLKGLQVEGRYNYQIYRQDVHKWGSSSGVRWDYVKDEVREEASLNRATIYNYALKSKRVNMDLLIRYNTTLWKYHDLGLLAGYSGSLYDSDSFDATKEGMSSWYLIYMNSATKMNSINGSATNWRMQSYFGRLNYAYRGKYLFEANVRYDGSSRFSPDSRWGAFPSFSLGWRLSEEYFMAGTKDYLSNLKLRLSYGKSGNNRTSDYAWQGTYGTAPVVIDGKQTMGLAVSKIGNNYLEWESTKALNVGLDFGFFDNRLTGEVEYYNKNTTGILFTPSIYMTMGFKTAVTENIAEVNNKGLEVSIKWNSHIHDFCYSLGGNFSYNKNRVEKYKGALQKYWGEDGQYVNNFAEVSENGFGGRIAEGYMLGETYIYKVYRGNGNYDGSGILDLNAGPKDGVIRTEQDMAWVKMMMESGYKFAGNTQVAKNQLWYGDLIYQDTNGDGNYGDSNDQDFSGHSNMPKYYFGFNLSLSYKNFDFSALLSGAVGFHLIWVTQPAFTTGYNSYQFIADDHYFYDPEKPTSPKTNLTATYPRLGNKNGVSSDFWEYSGNYLKLKNIQIGYTLPQYITRKVKIEKVRLYASADNLKTWTKFPGMDPEIGTSITYPLMKQCAFGLQLTF